MWATAGATAPKVCRKVCGFSAPMLRDGHDGYTAARSYAGWTVKTYAVTWREPDGQTFVGSLALEPS